MTQSPISELILVASKEHCPPNATCLEYSKGGSDGNLFESTWRHKGKRFLCIVKETTAASVVTDVMIVTDEDPVPVGFSAISQTKDEAGQKGLRKHILCVKIEQATAANKAVTDIVLINRGKGDYAPPNYYTITHEVNELQLSYSLKSVTPRPVPAPRLKVNVDKAAVNKSQLRKEIIPYSPSVVLAGVPVLINPKFDSSQKMNDPYINEMEYLTIDQLNSEFKYDFSVENETINK